MKEGMKISRADAIKIAKNVHDKTERSRREFAESEAGRFACPDCEDKDNRIAELEAENVKLKEWCAREGWKSGVKGM